MCSVNVRFEADDFLLHHDKELDYLVLCPLCVEFPQNIGPRRKIFRYFLKCKTNIQEEILASRGLRLLTKSNENFLKDSLDIYRIYETKLLLGVSYPTRSDNYIPMLEQGIKLYRFQEIPTAIRNYKEDEERAKIHNRMIRKSFEDETGHISWLNENRETMILLPFDICNGKPRFFHSPQFVLYCSDMYLLLFKLNKVIKSQENVIRTKVDEFLEKDWIIYFEDLYYLTLYALMVMMNNERERKTE